MPRNGSGTFTLAQAAFTPNTTISSAAVNSDLTDIASALTQSISADGQTPITGILKLLSGSAGTPSVAFTADATSGVFQPAVSQFALVAATLGLINNGVAFAVSAAPAVVAAGSGYVVGDQITLTGGTALLQSTVQVATLSGSGVATVTLVEAGRYIVKPTNPAAQGSTTGSGTGATFTLTWNTVLALTDLSNAQLWQALGGTAYFKNNIVNANNVASFLGASGVIGSNLAGSAMSSSDVMINGTIAQSQGGNAQTFAIKTLAGNDPSVGDPVKFVFRDVTASAGDYLMRTVTAALSITIPAGQAMGFTNSTPARIWIGVLDNAGTVELFVLNCLTGTSITPLQNSGFATTSAVSGASSSGVAYSTIARTSKPFATIGFATWEAGGTLAVAGTWNALATRLQIFQPGSTPLPGTLIQCANNTTSTVGTTSSATFAALTNGQTQAITLTSSANIVKVEGYGSMDTGAGASQSLQLSRGVVAATGLFGSIARTSLATSFDLPASVVGYDAPGVLTAVTYAIQGKASANTLSYPSPTGASALLSCTEIMA